MRRASKVALGGTVASAALVGGLAAAGVFATSAAIVVTSPPAAHAEGLTPFGSCDALLRWYVDRGVKDVGPYGWDGMIVYDDAMRLPVAMKGLDRLSMASADLPARTASLDARASSTTGTNTQEADVDEPDVAKTDGSLVARIVGDRKLVLVDVAHGEPTVTHRYWLPTDGYGAELLLLGDHVLITQNVYRTGGPGGGLDRRVPLGYGYGTGSTRLLDIDISDPHAPRLLSTQVYTGSLLAARQYGDTVRLVTSTSRPELPFVMPGKHRTRHEALLHNQAVVRASTIDDWLPAVTRDGTKHRLVDCTDVSHPDSWSGASTVAVTTLAADDLTSPSSVAITADGGIVYSSADRLYVSSTYDRDTIHPGLCDTCDVALRPSQPVTTQVHAFALDGRRTTYVGSGQVLGTLRDRWSLDEHGGDLRVAWTRYGPRGGTRNGITVLGEKDGHLEPIGTVAGLGTNEDIQSVRWFDDLAVVVTFRQIDPLYTIDLSDPAHPRTLGALHLPGYSGYLHPIGDGRVLGLGMEANGHGRVLGTQAAVFDISDPVHPERLSRVELQPGEAGIGALDDPRGFTWVPDSATGVTAVDSWQTGKAHLVALTVGDSGALSRRVVADLNQDWQVRTLALPAGRLAILDSHRVRVVPLG